MNNDLAQLLTPLLESVQEVGRQVKNLYTQYQRDTVLEIQSKADDSPVTAADFLSHDLLCASLKKLTPELPILSEEKAQPTFAKRQSWQRYWLLDPLDGTREFIEGTGDFVINLALIEQYRPILGVVYAPVTQTCYFAYQGGQAYKQVAREKPQIIQTRSWQSNRIMVVVSRRHGTSAVRTFLDRIGNHQILNVGSALKFGLVAEGVADIYVRMGPTSEWDTAAGQCIVEAAGGRMFDEQGQTIQYNTKDSLINPSFLAVGDPQYNWLQYLPIRK